MEIDQANVPVGRKSTKTELKLDAPRNTKYIFEGDVSLLQFFKLKQKPSTPE